MVVGVDRSREWTRVQLYTYTQAVNPYKVLFSIIEDFFLRPAVKKAIVLLLSWAYIKVSKDALAHLGPYQTLMWARDSDPGGENTVHLPATIQI